MESTFRSLGRAEAMFWFLGQANCGNGMIAAELSGDLARERFEQALRRAQRRHHFLRARVGRRGLGMVVEFQSQPPPIAVQSGQLAGWQDEVTRQMDLPFSLGVAPLMRGFWFRDQGPNAVVALVFSHMICDGLAAVSLLREVLEDATSPGTLPERPPLEPRPPLEALCRPSSISLVARFFAHRIGDWVRLGLPRRLPGFRDVVFRQRDVGLLSLHLDKEPTAALSSRCRAERTTVNGALAAALLFSLREELPSADAVTLAISSPVDLRSRCSPALAADEVGNYIGHVVTVHRMARSARFWELARQFNAELHKYVKEGQSHAVWLGLPPATLPLPLGIWARFLTALERIQPPSAMLTNVGRVGAIDLRGGVQVRHVWLGLSPIYRDALALCAFSFQNVLSLNLTYAAQALASDRAERIAARLHATLLRETSAPGA